MLARPNGEPCAFAIPFPARRPIGGDKPAGCIRRQTEAALRPQAFHPPPAPLASIHDIDLVVISHGHYDHLIHPTAVEIAKRRCRFVTWLGVGSHLERWGVPPEWIVELDWWEEVISEGLSVTATPSRHFSGRHLRMRGRYQTPWAGVALRNEDDQCRIDLAHPRAPRGRRGRRSGRAFGVGRPVAHIRRDRSMPAARTIR